MLLLAVQILSLVLVEAEVAFHVDLLDLELVLDLDQTDAVFLPAAPLSSWQLTRAGPSSAHWRAWQGSGEGALHRVAFAVQE